MKALVVGFGSIGKRHHRVLSELGHQVAVVTRRDAENGLTAYGQISDAVKDFSPAYAVIASRTNEHAADLMCLSDNGFEGTVLVEKPLFDHHVRVPDNSFESAYVGYNLRFHPVLRRLKEIVGQAVTHAVHAYVGQYLPEWRPGTDYRVGASAKRGEGGGVLRDLSHEIDYLTWMLGDWRAVTAAGGHFSELEIDSDDVYSILFRTERCPIVSIQMNYLDRNARREIIALTDQGTARADLIAGTIEWQQESEEWTTQGDDTYRAEHMAVLAGAGNDLSSLDDGLDVVAMIAAAERAAAEDVWISR